MRYICTLRRSPGSSAHKRLALLRPARDWPRDRDPRFEHNFDLSSADVTSETTKACQIIGKIVVRCEEFVFLLGCALARELFESDIGVDVENQCTNGIGADSVQQFDAVLAVNRRREFYVGPNPTTRFFGHLCGREQSLVKKPRMRSNRGSDSYIHGRRIPVSREEFSER